MEATYTGLAPTESTGVAMSSSQTEPRHLEAKLATLEVQLALAALNVYLVDVVVVVEVPLHRFLLSHL